MTPELRIETADQAYTVPSRSTLAQTLASVERFLLLEALARSKSKAAAARELGICREAIYSKMRRLGIKVGPR